MRNECPICFSTKIKRDNGDYKCERCQHVFPDKTNLEPPNPPTTETDAIKSEPMPAYLMGWVCPKCGSVMSPYQNYCIKCTGVGEFTWDSGTPIYGSETTGQKYITTLYKNINNGSNK